MNYEFQLKDHRIINLEPLNLDNVDQFYYERMNNKKIMEYTSHCRFPLTKEDCFNHIKNQRNENRIIWKISGYTMGIGTLHIGNITLQEIDFINRLAEIAIIIWDEDYHGMGIATKAMKYVINHAFNRLNLHRIYLGTPDENTGMRCAAINAGMIHEGYSLGAFYHNGEYKNLVHYHILNNYIENEK